MNSAVSNIGVLIFIFMGIYQMFQLTEWWVAGALFMFWVMCSLASFVENN